MKKLISNNVIFWIIGSILSFYVLVVFVKNPGINGYERAMFSEMIYGTAWKPFVYRALLPTTVCVSTSLVPEKLQNSISKSVTRSKLISSVLEKFKWESEFITEYIITSILIFLSLIGFLFSFKLLFREIYITPLWFSNLIALLGMLALPAMFQYYSYIYDFPALFLFTLGLVLLKQKKWSPFIWIYLIACLNKETTILLTLIFAIYFYNDPGINKRAYRNLIALQLIIFIAIKVLLYFIFIDNPGSLVEFHLFDRNYLLWNGYNLVTYVVFLSIIMLVFSHWNDKPKFLKDALWIAVPLVILTFFLGFLDELRDYYEVYPIVFLLITFNIAKFLGIDLKQNGK